MTFREKYKAEQSFSTPPELIEQTAARMREAASETPKLRTKGRGARIALSLAAVFALVLAGSGYYGLVLRGAGSADLSAEPGAPNEAVMYDSAAGGTEAAEDIADVNQYSSIEKTHATNAAQGAPGADSTLALLEFTLDPSAAETELIAADAVADTLGSTETPSVTSLPVYSNAYRFSNEDGAGDAKSVDVARQASLFNGLTPAAPEADTGILADSSSCLSEVGVYPLRTAEEAKASLLAGEYLTTASDLEVSDAAIQGVELTYYGSDRLELVQPVYTFYIRLDLPDGTARGQTMCVRCWVPAVQSEYVQIVK